jgi:Transposase zinc-binding domain/Putative transposase
MQTATCFKQSQMIYRPRRPEKTVLFGVIKKHYRTWKQNLKHPLPRYVEKTFEKYLDCGNPAKGFAWAYCNSCHTDFKIAFSCKRRGICPSCSALTMVKTAAHLVDELIPAILIRQWVISFPLRIRHYLLEPGILQHVLEIVVDEIRKTVIACSQDVLNPQIGAVSFLHSFGTTLNVHPHFHLIFSDGIFLQKEIHQNYNFEKLF